MRSFLRLVVPALFLAVLLAGPAGAQYMRITTDNPVDNTRLRPSGSTTLLTITLNTNHDKNNALQTCNSHSSANCSAPATAQPLDMFGYTLTLKAVGGTVTWGTFSASDAAYTDSNPQISSSTEVEINQFRATGTVTAPGLATLGTISVTPLTGAPSVQVQVGPGALNPFGFGTGFATTCDGFFFPNFYVVGDPLDPCGASSGSAGDWFDWDGVGVTIDDNRPPSIVAPATASASEGSPMATITATAADVDFGTLTITQVGMPADLTFTTNSPGLSPRMASISGAPGFTDAGSYNIIWTVNDGSGGLSATSSTRTTLTIANTNRAPVLNPVANMTICDGATADQVVSGSDADGDALTFGNIAGPIFMTVTTLSPTTGNIHLAPPLLSFPGTFPATVRASDGQGGVTDRSFTVTIPDCDRAPTLDQPANMTVKRGATADQAISGSDPFGAPLTFIKVAGPSFMALIATGPTTANIHLDPPGGTVVGDYAATVRASSGSFSDQKTFTITVTNGSPPVLNPIANMTVPEGDTQDQAVSGTDADGDRLTFTKETGPSYMTVTTISNTTGNIHVATNFTSAGTYPASVTAYDGILRDTKSFTITVCLGCRRPPVLDPLSDMWVPPGGTQDQAVSGSDPEGDALTFSKDAGPSFMTVSTTSPTTGNIHLAPPGDATGAPPVGRVAASDGVLIATQSFFIHLCPCPQPILAPLADITVNEGMTADRTISATDPSGNPLEFFKGIGPSFMTVTTTSSGSTASGNIHLAPGPGDAGTYIASVRASEGLVFVERTFTITVRSTNRCPTATPGGVYTGVVGVPIHFDGSVSSDPDGNPLTYAWDFDASDGLQVDAVGVAVSHTYSVGAVYVVSLTVTDNGNGDPAQVCSDRTETSALVNPACPVAIFNGYDTIRLGSGKPFWFAYVQSTSNCYANPDVVVSSFVMKYAGRQISASGKTSVGGDKSGDGIDEIKVTFSKDDLRALFSGTGLPNGHSTVTVALEADLSYGTRLSGTTQLDVVNNGNFTAAEVAPNPLNPQAILSYVTTRSGPVRIDLFSIQGRLVRRLVDSPDMAAGAHEAIIDGRGTRGEKLPSGVYYIRGTSSEGEFKRLVTILK